MRKAQRHIDFAAFIQNHEEEIFGKKRKLTGQSYVLAYRKQIAALDMKMNEFINKDDPRARDLTFLLVCFFHITVRRSDQNGCKSLCGRFLCIV